jgi:WD40 repeat protein
MLLGSAAVQNWGIAESKPLVTSPPEGAPNIAWEQTGHSSRVNAVPFSPDGQLLVSGSEDQNIKLWRAADGGLLRTLKVRFGGANFVAFSPDGQILAVGTAAVNQNLYFFRVADGALIRKVTAHSNGTTSVAFTPDGALLVSGGRDRTAKLWRVSDGALISSFSQGIRVISVAVSPDGQVVAAGGSNGEIKLWRVADGALLGILTGHTDYVFSLAFSADGTKLASGGADESMRLWAIPGGSLIHAIPVPNSGSATSVAFTRDGQTVIAGTSELLNSPDGTVQSLGALRFWRVSDGALLLTYDQQTSITVNSIALSPDGGFLSYGRQDGGVVVARSPF